MSLDERPSATVHARGSRGPGSDPHRVVVSVGGAHDIATRADLDIVMVQAARLDGADVVVDLSAVTFMDASTISAIVGAHNRLRAHSRSLTVRAPSRPARRLLDVCDLAFLVEEPPGAQHESTALGSWVAVPASDPARDPAPALLPSPGAPRRAGVEAAGSVPHRRAPT